MMKTMIPSTKVYLGIYTKEEAVVVNYRSTTGVN
jgi:hypothetical protein